jgi:hypothetical protein
MKYAQITESNPIPEVNNRHCQLLLEGMYFPYLETKGSPGVAWAKRIQDISKASTAVHEIENTKRNFEIVGRVFEGFCDHLAQPVEEQRWTFDNLIATLGKGGPSSGRSRLEINLLKNTSNKVLMYYLNASKFRSYEEYSNTDVNLYKDVLMKALTMADLSIDASSISWLGGVLRNPWSVVYCDSTSERIQQVLEKPWKAIQETFLKILSELRAMPAIHLERLSQIPSEVLYFCYQQQILQYVPVTIDVIERSFSTTITEVKMVPEKDSETGEEWLELKIRIKGEVKEVLDNYDKYTDLLVSSLPWSARYKMRLSYKIV